jgi:hypothetical protein
LHNPINRSTGKASRTKGSRTTATGMANTKRIRNSRNTRILSGNKTTNPKILNGSNNRKAKALKGKTINSNIAEPSLDSV